MILHLETAERLLYNDSTRVEAMTNHCLELGELLSDEDSEVEAAAAKFFSQIAKHPTGKEGLRQYDVTPRLYQGIESINYDVINGMSKALQFAAIDRDSRKQALYDSFMTNVLRLISLPNLPVITKLNLIRSLTNVAELPQGRQSLRELIRTDQVDWTSLRQTAQGRDALNEFLTVVNWTP